MKYNQSLQILICGLFCALAFFRATPAMSAEPEQVIIIDDFEEGVGAWRVVPNGWGLCEGAYLKQTNAAFIGQYAMDVRIPGREKGNVELTFTLPRGYPLGEENVDGLAFYIKAKDNASAQQKFWVRLPAYDWGKRWTNEAVIGDTNWHKIILKRENFVCDKKPLTRDEAGKKLFWFELIFSGEQPEINFVMDCFHGWNAKETDEEVRLAAEKENIYFRHRPVNFTRALVRYFKELNEAIRSCSSNRVETFQNVNGTLYLGKKPVFLTGVNAAPEYDYGRFFRKHQAYGDHLLYRKRFDREIADALGMGIVQLDIPEDLALPPKYAFGPGGIAGRNHQGKQDYIDFLKSLDGLPAVVQAPVRGEPKRMLKNAELLNLPVDTLHYANAQHSAFCMQNPIGREINLTAWKESARFLLANGGNPLFYEFYNELHTYNCDCQYNRANFRKFMEDKYKSIDALNSAYNSNYKSFDELLHYPPSKYGDFPPYYDNPPLAVDWSKYMGDTFAQMLVDGKKAIREVDKRENVFFGIQQAVNQPFWRRKGFDFYKVAQVSDYWASEGSYSFGTFASSALEDSILMALLQHRPLVMQFNLDIARSLMDGKLVTNHELYFYRFQDGKAVPCHPEDIVTTYWAEVIHGSSASLHFSWGKNSGLWRTLADAEKLDFSGTVGGLAGGFILNPYLYPPDVLMAGYKTFRKEIDELGEIVLPQPRIKADVAVMLSNPTERITPGPDWNNSWQSKYAEPIILLHKGLLLKHFPVDFLWEEDLKEKCGRYKVIAIPSATHTYPETLNYLTEYVKNGGTVVAFDKALSFDEYSKARDSNSFLGVTRKDKPGEKQMLTLQNETFAVTNSQQVTLTSGEMVSAYEGGQAPAIVRNSLGAGKVYYIAPALSSKNTRLFDFIEALLDSVVKLERPLRVIDKETSKEVGDVEAQIIDRGNTKVLFFVNWNPIQARPVAVKLNKKILSEGSYRVADPIKKEEYRNGHKTAVWQSEDLIKDGIIINLPPQVRTIITLSREK